MQQKGDKLAGLMAEALALGLQHDVPYTVYYIMQLASLCSIDLQGKRQHAAEEGWQAGREARGQAMLQVLVQLAPTDAALAGVLLQVITRLIARQVVTQEHQCSKHYASLPQSMCF